MTTIFKATESGFVEALPVTRMRSPIWRSVQLDGRGVLADFLAGRDTNDLRGGLHRDVHVGAGVRSERDGSSPLMAFIAPMRLAECAARGQPACAPEALAITVGSKIDGPVALAAQNAMQ